MKTPRCEAVVVGASAGALDALFAILPPLPRDYPMPVMVVIHLPAHNESLMTELLDAKCQLEVCEAEDKMPIKPGAVYLAPPDYHLLVEAEKWLSLSNEEPVNHSRPSIDVLFESAADVFGPGLLGAILTGANQDGAKGLQAVVRKGGAAVVQRPELAESSTMPQCALDACPQARAMSLEELSTYLLEIAAER